MSQPQIDFAYPTAWPVARPRSTSRQPARWRANGSRILFDAAVARLREQAGLVTGSGQSWRMREMTLSTNFELRVDGRPRRDRGAPFDPGVAFFFELDGEPHVLACDRWDTVADNVAAIAAHIEALRGQERWGVSDMKQAFAGHVALPAPEQWWQVLGINEHSDAELINAAYRRHAKFSHPDNIHGGGTDAAMARLNAARDAGLQAVGQ